MLGFPLVPTTSHESLREKGVLLTENHSLMIGENKVSDYDTTNSYNTVGNTTFSDRIPRLYCVYSKYRTQDYPSFVCGFDIITKEDGSIKFWCGIGRKEHDTLEEVFELIQSHIEEDSKKYMGSATCDWFFGIEEYMSFENPNPDNFVELYSPKCKCGRTSDEECFRGVCWDDSEGYGQD